MCFIAVAGFATTSFGGALTLSGFGGLPLDDSTASPTPSAIVSPFTYNGTTAGGPTFNRPNANGNSAPTALSATGTAVPYDVVMFTVATAGSYSFLSTANYDNFLVLYSGSFTATSPLAGAVIANDDFPTVGRSGFSSTLATGTTYFLVTTGFGNINSGTFTDVITLVPEPGTWAMVGAGLVGLVVVQRLRRRTA